MNPVIIIGIAIIILVAVIMAALLRGDDTAQKKRNLSIIRGQSAEGKNTKTAKADAARRRADDITKKLKEQADAQKSEKLTLSQLLDRAGLAISVKKFIIIFILLSFLVMAFFMFVVKWPPVACPIVGLIFFFGGQKIFIGRRIKKRQKKFLTEFADALDGIVRLLKAGMPVTEAIKMCSREFDGPVGEEMTKIYDSQKIGIPLPEAVLDSARRMPLTEMQMFATGISIQAQTGASLSDVLTNLANVIRARFKLKRKIQALSSEAKASAMIIGALPFVVGGGMFLINPSFIEPLFSTFAGKILVAGSAVWMLMGIMVMKAMINFKI